MWEPLSFFVIIGLAKWARYEWQMMHRPPRHIYRFLGALERQPATPIGDFESQYH